MQRFAIIGMGRFGTRLAANLAAMGQEVIAIDRNRRLIEEVRDRVTLAIALDATDEQALKMQGIEKVDVAFVTVGENFETTVLTTAVLKQMGVQRVISRANTAVQARILKRVGADDVANPEDESADRWSNRLISPQFLKQYELDSHNSIVEVALPKAWVGKTLIELRPRNELGVHVLAIKRTGPDECDAAGEEAAPDQEQEPRLCIPVPDQPLRADDVLVVMGSDEALAGMPKQ
jgi:trk system potassium uptake protein TrkA